VCLGEIGCAVLGQFEWVWGSDCVMFVGQFCMGLGDWFNAVCGRIWYAFGEVSVC